MALRKIIDNEVYKGIRCVEYRQNGHLIAFWVKTETEQPGTADIIQLSSDFTFTGESNLLPKIILEFPETVEFSTDKPFEPVTYIGLAETIIFEGADGDAAAKEVIQLPATVEFKTRANELIQYVNEFSEELVFSSYGAELATKAVNRFPIMVSFSGLSSSLVVKVTNRFPSFLHFLVKQPVIIEPGGETPTGDEKISESSEYTVTTELITAQGQYEQAPAGKDNIAEGTEYKISEGV